MLTLGAGKVIGKDRSSTAPLKSGATLSAYYCVSRVDIVVICLGRPCGSPIGIPVMARSQIYSVFFYPAFSLTAHIVYLLSKVNPSTNMHKIGLFW